MADTSVMDSIREWFLGTDGVLTNALNSVGESIDEAQGYGKRIYDETMNSIRGTNEFDLPSIQYDDTPLFWLMEQFYGINPDTLKAEANLKKRWNSTFENLLDQVDALEKSGVYSIPDTKMLDAILPDREKGATVTTQQVRNAVIKAKDDYSNLPETQKVMDLDNDVSTIIQGMEAVSPLLVATAMFKPEWTRKLMGLHLINDALSGVMNFRSPNRAEGYSFWQWAEPYAAMGAIGVTSIAADAAGL